MLKGDISCPQRKMQWLSLKKEGLGTPTLAGSCAAFCWVEDLGVGNYKIHFNNNKVSSNFISVPFGRKADGTDQIPEVLVTVVTDNRIAKIGAVTKSDVIILTEDLTGAAAEADFHVMIVGTLASDLLG